MKNSFLLIIVIFVSQSIYSQGYLKSLNNKNDFEVLSGIPLSAKYGQVSALKIVYDLKTDKLYFINSKNFKYHHDFCSVKLNYTTEIEYFNKVNYSEDSRRRFLLANINYFKSLDVYALELSPVDLMSVEQIVFLYRLVSESTFIGENLRFLLGSSRLQMLEPELSNDVLILNPSEVYQNLNYQAISKNKNCGILKYIENLDQEIDNIKPLDIIVLNETPVYLPKVAGVIVTKFQTPLSHLTILGQNRKIPISAYKPAFNDLHLQSLSSEKVCYKVLADTFVVERVDKLNKNHSNQKAIRLKYDLSVDSLVDVERLNKKSYRFCGNKASNFGVLHKLSKQSNFKVPECAFVIPFYFYNEHIQNSGTEDLIENLLCKNLSEVSSDSLNIMLKSIRKKISNTPVNERLLTSINKKVEAEGEYTRLRFRSSTNAEDARGFSGAGLYTSKTGILNDEKKSFKKAIKKVWASLWSYEAFLEREYYNINHREAFMGILVHRSFPEEKVNGVAVTKNLYRPDNYGFVVNAQLGNESVVQPSSGVISDQFICYPNIAKNVYENKQTVDIITQSSLNNNELLMTEGEIQTLANQLELIKKYFTNYSPGSVSYLNFGLDIEFKLDGQQPDLYVKQVRYYND